MSLILEALRKSEAERRRGLAPDVALELPPAPTTRQRTLAAWLLPALMVALLLILAGWWAKRSPSTAVAPAAVVDATDTPANQDAPAPALSPRTDPTPAAAAVTIPPAPELQVRASPVQVTAATSPPMPASAPSSVASNTIARPTPIQAAPAQPISPQAPTDSSTSSAVLPPIKLSMHMWDDVPSRRFVIVNGQRMAEGESYGGITVLAIERAGVLVESNGAKARVPLP